MFMSAMAGGKTLSSWGTASYVVRAVSPQPAGPYRLVQDNVLPVFHHNPQVVRASDGTFLLFSIGQTAAGAGDAQAATASTGAVFRTELHWSSSIAGPWQSMGCVINGSNPSPHALPNGTIVVAYKGLPNGLRIASAPHWRGPYTTLSKPGSVTTCCGDKSGAAHCCGEILLSPTPYGHPFLEDFFLWFDAQARRWAMVLHQVSFDVPTLPVMRSLACTPEAQASSRIACPQYDFNDKALSPGGFAYSAGESLLSSWHLAGTNHSVYGETIALVGGKTLSADRQRPKLLFTDGVPSYLFNGLDPHGQKGPTHTFVVRIKSWEPPYDTH